MKKVNIAVIGCSGMARNHMKGVVNCENAHLYAICDIHDEQIAEAKKLYTPDVITKDYKDLVTDPNVDAVILVVPDQLHLEMTEAFLRAGKKVLCEKPMALSMEECNKMREIEKETNGYLMIGQVCRMTPAFRLAKGLVEQGRIGELFFVESEYAHCYEKAKGVDNWRMTPERDGFIGGGCHAVDLLRWIAGDPTEVTAYSNHKCLEEWPTNDCTVAIFKFPNNVIGKVMASIGCKRDYTMRTVLYGTMGTIICDNTSPTLQLFTDTGSYPGGKSSYTVPTSIPVNINNHNVGQEIIDFVNAINAGEPSPVSSLEGASTVAVCTSAVKSAKEGKTIQIKYPE